MKYQTPTKGRVSGNYSIIMILGSAYLTNIIPYVHVRPMTINWNISNMK